MDDVSDANLLGLIRGCIRDLQHEPTVDEYDRWHPKPPSAKMIITRFGKWHDAIKQSQRGPCAKTFAETARKPKLLDYFRISGDCMVTCDFHIPCHHAGMCEYMVAVAKRFNIKRLVIIGDLLDFASLNRFKIDNKNADIGEVLDSGRETVALLLMWFDQIYWSIGNHDDRYMQALFDEANVHKLGHDISDYDGTKLFVSKHPYIVLDGEWRMTHPKSYSRIPARVPATLCSKFLMSVIGAHGHHFGICTDVSGEYVAAELGCMTDLRKHPYLMHSDTTHPAWNLGFGMMRNGTLYPFTAMKQLTDWEFWLGDKAAAKLPPLDVPSVLEARPAIAVGG